MSDSELRLSPTGQTTLTRREKEIAALVSAGLSNKSVARQLELSEGNVKQHLHAIFRKLGIRSRASLHLLSGR